MKWGLFHKKRVSLLRQPCVKPFRHQHLEAGHWLHGLSWPQASQDRNPHYQKKPVPAGHRQYFHFYFFLYFSFFYMYCPSAQQCVNTQACIARRESDYMPEARRDDVLYSGFLWYAGRAPYVLISLPLGYLERFCIVCCSPGRRKGGNANPKFPSFGGELLRRYTASTVRCTELGYTTLPDIINSFRSKTAILDFVPHINGFLSFQIFWYSPSPQHAGKQPFGDHWHYCRQIGES